MDYVKRMETLLQSTSHPISGIVQKEIQQHERERERERVEVATETVSPSEIPLQKLKARPSFLATSESFTLCPEQAAEILGPKFKQRIQKKSQGQQLGERPLIASEQLASLKEASTDKDEVSAFLIHPNEPRAAYERSRRPFIFIDTNETVHPKVSKHFQVN